MVISKQVGVINWLAARRPFRQNFFLLFSRLWAPSGIHVLFLKQQIRLFCWLPMWHQETHSRVFHLGTSDSYFWWHLQPTLRVKDCYNGCAQLDWNIPEAKSSPSTSPRSKSCICHHFCAQWLDYIIWIKEQLTADEKYHPRKYYFGAKRKRLKV